MKKVRRADEDTFRVEDANCIGENAKAILVEAPSFMNDSDARVDRERGVGRTWIPKSQLSGDTEVCEPGQEGVLIVSMWLAKQRSWA